MQPDAVARATERESAVAVNGAHLQGHADKLAEGVPTGYVCLFAPRMEVVRHLAIIVTVAGCGAPLVRRATERILFRDTCDGGKVGDQIPRFIHHRVTSANGLWTFGGLFVRLRLKQPIRLRGLILEKVSGNTRLHPTQAPRRRNGRKGSLPCGRGFNNSGNVKGGGCHKLPSAGRVKANVSDFGGVPVCDVERGL